MKLEDIAEAVAKYHPEANLDIIWDAYIYSAKAHRHQSRRSGAAYISQNHLRSEERRVGKECRSRWSPYH